MTKTVSTRMSPYESVGSIWLNQPKYSNYYILLDGPSRSPPRYVFFVSTPPRHGPTRDDQAHETPKTRHAARRKEFDKPITDETTLQVL